MLLTEIGDGSNGRINRELLVVCAEPVAVCIGIREETRLKDRIRGGFEAGYKVGG